MAEPSPLRRSPLAAALGAAAVAAVGFCGFAVWRAGDRLGDLRADAAANAAVLQQVLGEVTRLRLEQSAGGKGPQALLEKLRTYAPLLADSRTTEPDYKNARAEMAAILRAFATLGTDARAPIEARLAQLSPEKDFDELKWLLEAMCTVDEPAGVKLLGEVLLGRKLPSPRLRWWAADLLLRRDRPLAQNLLRQVLLTESARGFNPEHAAAFPGAVVPDQGALTAGGSFFVFVTWYARSGDPKCEDTLLQVIGRAEHDENTVRECVKTLAELKSQKAVPAIERLYQRPPLGVQNPIFLNHCLTALFDIQGSRARPFLEAALPTAATDLVAKHIQHLLSKC